MLDYNLSGVYRSKIIAIALAWFLGTLGVHNFYLNRKWQAVTQLVLIIVGLITAVFLVGFLLIFIVEIWAIVDIVRISITPNTDDFDWPLSDPNY